MDDQNKPKIVQDSSLKMVMDPGTYLRCTCGRSKNQPFCDDSHIGTNFEPEEIVITSKRIIPWCMCYQSKRGHICDNSHRFLP